MHGGAARRPLRRRGCLPLLAILCAAAAAPGAARAEQGRLLGTGGATVLEGSGGGGIVPWATLSGYGTEDELGGALAITRVRVDDYRLDTHGGSFTLWNRLELSAARHRLEARPFDTFLRQDMFGAKLRIGGDLVYTTLPQLSVGAELKHNRDFALPRAVGARRRNGVDYYVAGTKLFLGGLFGYNVIANGTLRATRANQLGLLGFGGDRRSRYSLVPEGSLAVMLTPKAVVGYEYRSKPDNLRAIREDDWQDFFFAYFLNKHLALVGAQAELGEIAGAPAQNGWYISLQGSF